MASVTYMLDTNILIYLMKNKPISVAQKIDSLEVTSKLVMSYVTYAELLKGAENSQRKVQTLAQLDKLTNIIEPVYPNDVAICQHYATQFLQLKAKGTPIGGNDLWIGCHALAHKSILVTHNVKEFKRIEGLIIEDWVSD